MVSKLIILNLTLFFKHRNYYSTWFRFVSNNLYQSNVFKINLSVCIYSWIILYYSTLYSAFDRFFTSKISYILSCRVYICWHFREAISNRKLFLHMHIYILFPKVGHCSVSAILFHLSVFYEPFPIFSNSTVEYFL